MNVFGTWRPNFTLFVFIVFVTGTFAAESDKVIYGLVFPIRTFEVLYVQVNSAAPPSICLSQDELSDFIDLVSSSYIFHLFDLFVLSFFTLRKK